jgi:hypothetical protein
MYVAESFAMVVLGAPPRELDQTGVTEMVTDNYLKAGGRELTGAARHRETNIVSINTLEVGMTSNS